MYMGKPGVTLPAETIRLYRAAFDAVLEANDDFKAIVDAATKGLKGAEKQKAKLRAINRLIRRNDAFRDAVRLELGEKLAQGEHRTS
jgi:hypothetical protein